MVQPLDEIFLRYPKAHHDIATKLQTKLHEI
jgi:hypothetical protein